MLILNVLLVLIILGLPGLPLIMPKLDYCWINIEDNQNTFNNVWHIGLLYKLYKLGMNGIEWRFVSVSFRESNIEYIMKEIYP
jgi:hypothetical protein